MHQLMKIFPSSFVQLQELSNQMAACTLWIQPGFTADVGHHQSECLDTAIISVGCRSHPRVKGASVPSRWAFSTLHLTCDDTGKVTLFRRWPSGLVIADWQFLTTMSTEGCCIIHTRHMGTDFLCRRDTLFSVRTSSDCLLCLQTTISQWPTMLLLSLTLG